nr:MAG TPA: hypothetical protein [Caudoviricetes sp.]
MNNFQNLVTLKSIKNGASFTPFFTNIKTMTKNE